MAHNLRRVAVDGETYISIMDLLRMLSDIQVMEGVHPEAVKALDGFGVGLALVTGVADMEDLPAEFKKRLGVPNG